MITVFSFIAVSTSSMGGMTVMKELLPRETGGWKTDGKAETYSGEAIYDYMNGAGEIYVAYGFQSLLVQRYARPKEPEIIIEVFDMGSSENAFGVFSHTQGREEGERGIGQGSEYRAGLLCFWKSSFFICIRAGKETPSTREAVLDLGKSVSRAIHGEGAKPKLLDYLPEESIMKKSVRCFRSHAILNYHFYLADKDILNIDGAAQGCIAEYRDGKGQLLVIQYPGREEAAAAAKSFIASYMPDAAGKGVIRTENGKWTAVQTVQRIVLIVFDALSEEDALSRIGAVKERIR